MSKAYAIPLLALFALVSTALPSQAQVFAPVVNPFEGIRVPTAIFPCSNVYGASDLPSTSAQLTARQFTLGQVGRAVYAAFLNISLLDCKVKNLTAAVGVGQANSVIDDTAPHSEAARNHSLYQRTIDLERSIDSLRAEVQTLSTALRTQNLVNNQTPQNTFIPMTPPVQNNPSPQETFIPPPVTPPAPSKTISNEECTNECSRTRIVCMKMAQTSKALQQCQVDETSCIAACSNK